jgi:acyl transferase domain-containing protein
MQNLRWKEQMSRLEDAEKRLHGAIARLENSLSARAKSVADDLADEADLSERASTAEAERVEMEKRMTAAAVRLDETIERLRGALSE